MTMYMVLESKSFYVTISFLKGIIIAFHKVDHYFFSSKLCLICLLQFFFITLLNKFFTIKVFYYLCPRHSLSNFPNLNHKNIFRQFWSVTFCKNVFTFSYMVTSSLWSSSLFSTLKSIYMPDFASTEFILIVEWYIWFHTLAIVANLLICTFLILKSYISHFYSLRF